MNPKKSSILALSLVVIAALIVAFSLLKQDPSPALDAGAGSSPFASG
jgi:hypothetical protein